MKVKYCCIDCKEIEVKKFGYKCNGCYLRNLLGLTTNNNTPETKYYCAECKKVEVEKEGMKCNYCYLKVIVDFLNDEDKNEV